MECAQIARVAPGSLTYRREHEHTERWRDSFPELRAEPEQDAEPVTGLVRVMRHVRRLQAHVHEWTNWYGATDVLVRHQLPLPPAGTVRILEELDEAISHASPPKREPLTDAQIDAIGFNGYTPATNRDRSEAECLRSFARSVERAHGIGDE